jgi:hypothetical protein
MGDDPPPSAVNALHGHVAGLRRTLEPSSRARGEILVAAGPGYLLRLEPGQLDAGRCSHHLDTAGALRAGGELDEAVRSFDEALQLWQSAPLSGAPGPWASPRAQPSATSMPLTQGGNRSFSGKGAGPRVCSSEAGPLGNRSQAPLQVTAGLVHVPGDTVIATAVMITSASSASGDHECGKTPFRPFSPCMPMNASAPRRPLRSASAAATQQEHPRDGHTDGRPDPT